METTPVGPGGPGAMAAVDESAIRGHYLATANGDFDTHGVIRSRPEDLDDIAERVVRFARRDGGAARPVPVLLWAHGGLVGEEGAAARVHELLEPMRQAGVYPIHLIWHTGFLEEVRDVFIAGRTRVPGAARAQGWLRDRLRAAQDGFLELAVRPLGRPIWSEMKADARDVCRGRGPSYAGPAFRLLDRLRSAGVEIAYHLVGHSAGSILHCHLFDWFVRNGVQVRTCSFLAPAVTTELFRRTIQANEASLGAFHLHTMADRDERDDHCGELPGTSIPIYHKSLLYLVAYSFEPDPPARLLGLARHVDADYRGRARDADAEVRGWLRAHARCEWRRPALERPGATLHGSFDEDPRTVAELIERVRG